VPPSPSSAESSRNCSAAACVDIPEISAIDNFSRKILAWIVDARLEPTSSCQVLLADSKNLDLPACDIDREQYVVANQSEPRHCFHGEEVHTDDCAEV